MDHLTVTEAAETLQLSVPTIKRYIYDGRLKSAKLPGGQHRIPTSEIERLLSTGELEAPAGEPREHGEPNVEQRLAVLERWITEVEAEMERVSATLSVLSRYISRSAQLAETQESESEESNMPHSITVLGPGCQKCEMLHDRIQRVLGTLGIEGVTVEHVRDLDAITDYGPILTPALVIDGVMVSSGRVPSEPVLKDMLTKRLK